MIALFTRGLPSMYLASEVMDDVSHAFHLERCKRALEQSNSIEEIRHIALDVITLMSAQRTVLLQVLEKWGDQP